MARFSEQDYREMAPELLRAILRENTHHRLEEPLYAAMFDAEKPRPGLGDGVERLLMIWRERGLPADGEDLQWSRQLVQMARELQAGGKPALDTAPVQPLRERDLEAVEQLIHERRSIRRWTDKAVPQVMVDQVIEAGLWAPHACNLQTLRVVVITQEKEMELFTRSEVMGGPVRIVVCQDLRPYEVTAGVPEHNRLLDCGAAVQNMLLMAQALGLGAVWLTFSPAQVTRLREYYELPDYIAIQTYLALGFPDESPLAPGRLTVADVLLNAVTSELPFYERNPGFVSIKYANRTRLSR